MKTFILFIAASLYAADPPAEQPKPPTVEQQLADAKAEIAALLQQQQADYKAIAEYQAWTQKAFTTLEGQRSGAVNSCLGQPPQVPAPHATTK